MKSLFSIILLGSVIASTITAQKSYDSHKPLLSLGAVTAPEKQSGSTNYLLALSDDDLKTKKYVFYTDSNSTVAYLKINGNTIRLTGGPNPEHIMAYVAKGYTVTISFSKSPSNTIIENADDHISVKTEAALTIYATNQTLIQNVTGAQINAVKK